MHRAFIDGNCPEQQYSKFCMEASAGLVDRGYFGLRDGCIRLMIWEAGPVV